MLHTLIKHFGQHNLHRLVLNTHLNYVRSTMEQIEFPQDFSEFLKLLNAHRVEYLLIGGFAVANLLFAAMATTL